MGSILSELDQEELKARSHLFECLEICSHSHFLARLLLDRIADESWSLLALANWPYTICRERPDSPDPDFDLDHASISDLNPKDKLVEMAREHFALGNERLVMSSIWDLERQRLGRLLHVPAKLVWFADADAYGVVDSRNDEDEIHDNINPNFFHVVGVFSGCEMPTTSGEWNEEIFCRIARNASCMFVPAYDMTGFLIVRFGRDRSLESDIILG
jgi:hypothetical protein